MIINFHSFYTKTTKKNKLIILLLLLFMMCFARLDLFVNVGSITRKFVETTEI